MAQTNASKGFHFPVDITAVAARLWDNLPAERRDDFERVVALLADRDRALEDHLSTGIPGFDEVLTEESTTSTTYTNLATVGPTVTVKLPRGWAIVTAGAYTTTTVTNQTCVMGISVDGGAAADFTLLGNNAGGGAISASVSATLLYGDLGPGTHTFQAKYLQSLGGATGRWAGRFLSVVPVL